MSNDTALMQPPQGIGELWRVAQYFAASRLFAFKTAEEAMALMLIAQAEGKHPALAARDYDIIQGRPALKSVAILARFQQAGGTVKWLKYSDAEVIGEFTHPQGGTLQVKWDEAKVKQAGLANKDNHKNYPAAMKRNRCIPEGVRGVYPACINGFASSDEILDTEIVRDAAATISDSQTPAPAVEPTIEPKKSKAQRAAESLPEVPQNGNGHKSEPQNGQAQVTNSEPTQAATAVAEPSEIEPDTLTTKDKIKVGAMANGKPMLKVAKECTADDLAEALTLAQAEIDDPQGTPESKAHAKGVIALVNRMKLEAPAKR